MVPVFSLVLPALDKESCSEAVSEYITAVSNNTDLKSMNDSAFSPSETKNIDCDELAALAPRPIPFLIVANEFTHSKMSKIDGRMVIQVFTEAGANPFMLPVGATLRLVGHQRSDFLSWITKAFPAMQALGGADFDPALYGEHSNGTDMSEIPYRARPT